MIKAAIFDLDSTLINSQRIKEDIFEYIKKITGGDDEFAMKIYLNARSSNQKLIFNMGSLKKSLDENIKNFDEKKWQDFLGHFKKTDKTLLIDGAEELLNYLMKKNIPIYILTLGVIDWQKSKMELSGLNEVLGDGFSNLKYTEDEDSKIGKIKEIKEILSELNLKNCEGVIFFNDRPDETLEIMREYPGLRVFIRREVKDVRHTDKDFEELAKKTNVLKIGDDLNLIEDIKKLL